MVVSRELSRAARMIRLLIHCTIGGVRIMRAHSLASFPPVYQRSPSGLISPLVGALGINVSDVGELQGPAQATILGR